MYKTRIADFLKEFLGFSLFDGNQILLEANFRNFDHFEPSLGPCELVKFPTKFGPDRLSRLNVYRIQTDRQTDKQSI